MARPSRSRRATAPPLPLSATRWISAVIRIASSHPAMEHVLDTVSRLSERPVRSNILLLGEPGTGKEGLARALHELTGDGGPLVGARLAGLSPARQHEELCAPRRGALAGAGRRGTLLLDEILALDPAEQRDLLDALRAPAAPRIIALSDGDVRAAVDAGRLRHDLYYRLARLVLYLPPLRERPEDIPSAAIWMGNRILRAQGLSAEVRLPRDPSVEKGDVVLTEEAIAALQEHAWQGNFRELEAALERALLVYRDLPDALDAAAVRRALIEPGVRPTV